MFKLTLERLPIRLEVDVGSIAEAVGLLQEQDTTIRQMISIADDMASEATGETTVQPGGAVAGEVPKAKRGRKANQPDPATATAPPPLAVPGAPPAAAPPALAAQNAAAAATGGIPEYLQRPTEAAAPPPPPLPTAPPIVPPVVPPSGVLAGKVIANLDQRKAGTPDNGQSLSDWLAQCGFVTKGASYDEAVAVLRMTPDDKLAAIAGQLGVA